LARYGNYYDSRASKGEGHEAYETSSCHAARLHALYRAAADGMPTLADPGYEDVGIGIQIPMQQPPDGRELDLDNRTRNTLQHTTANPSKITE
jgi:hypothetical protein